MKTYYIEVKLNQTVLKSKCFSVKADTDVEAISIAKTMRSYLNLPNWSCIAIEVV